MPRVVTLVYFLTFWAIANTPQKNLAPHVHGEGTLNFVVDTQSGEIELTIVLPALQVLGFEHKPKTDAEKKVYSDSHKRLKDHKSIFTLISAKNSKAACVFSNATLKVPYVSDHDHSHGQGHNHADYELSYRMSCKDARSIEGIKILAFQNLKALTKLKVEGLVADSAIAQELDPGHIDLLFK